MFSHASRYSHCIFVVFLVALLIGASREEAGAHATGENYIFLSVKADVIEGHFEIHEKDLKEKLGITMLNGTKEEVEAALTASSAKVQSYIREHFSMAPGNGAPYTLTFGETKLFDLESAGRFAQYHFKIPITGVPDKLKFDHRMLYENDRLHRAVLTFFYNHRTGKEYDGEFAALIFSERTPEQELDLTGDLQGTLKPLQFIWEGVWHIWIGIDHILFLIVLLLPAVLKRQDNEWQPVTDFSKAGWNVLKIVTVFTIAHSITLTLAALDWVRVPSRIVESVIAISIVLVALNNIFPKVRGGSIAIIFALGLFHGLGFASVMGDLPFRVAEIKRVLLGFNVGVELGQIAVVVPVFGLLFLLRKWRYFNRVILIGGSCLAGGVALFWFVQRAFDLG